MRIGDKVKLLTGEVATIVCNLDGGEYSATFTEADWSYLKSGLLVETEVAGLMHIQVADIAQISN